MKTLFAIAAVACTTMGACDALAQDAATPQRGMTPVEARYCDKLREGVMPFVHHVRRLKPIYQYTYTDFAPAYPGAPVVADCRVPAARSAAVHDYLRARL